MSKFPNSFLDSKATISRSKCNYNRLKHRLTSKKRDEKALKSGLKIWLENQFK